MAIQSDLDHGGGCVVDQSCTLLIIGEFKQLLAEIVPKWIWAYQQGRSR